MRQVTEPPLVVPAGVAPPPVGRGHYLRTARQIREIEPVRRARGHRGRIAPIIILGAVRREMDIADLRLPGMRLVIADKALPEVLVELP